MTPFTNGVILSIAWLGPPIAIKTVPLSAAGVAPKTGAIVVYQKLEIMIYLGPLTSNEGRIPFLQFFICLLCRIRMDGGGIHK
jgi:hypothetical protein